jgi:endonuclease YncB( thermonuclease family)
MFSFYLLLLLFIAYKIEPNGFFIHKYNNNKSLTINMFRRCFSLFTKRATGGGGGCFGSNGRRSSPIAKKDYYSDTHFNQEQYKLLQVIQPETVPYFTFDGLCTYALPCHIYDGDTFSAIFYHEDRLIKYRCRCLGYDSPEIKPHKDIENREKLIELAHRAKNRFTELLTKHPSKMVYIQFHGFDKYGRILVDVYNKVDSRSINEIMIEENHGKIYDGGKKDEWTIEDVPNKTTRNNHVML